MWQRSWRISVKRVRWPAVITLSATPVALAPLLAQEILRRLLGLRFTESGWTPGRDKASTGRLACRRLWDYFQRSYAAP